MVKPRELKLKNKFRHPVTNIHLLKHLFLELSDDSKYVLYTLAREDRDGIPSLYQAYMAEEDFTEFEFAIKYFETYQHWKKLCESSFFAGHIAEWREELELKIKARNLKSLIDKATSDSNVAKFLLGNKWVEDAQKNKGTNLRGRPSKEEIRQHLTLISSQDKQIDDDYKRIKN